MNQKLHTARSGLMIIFAVLCIVCLSLSLVLSAQFAAYAVGEEENALPDYDGTNYLWQVHYTVQEKNEDGSIKTDEDGNVIEREVVENLWNGIHEGNAINYLDAEGNIAVGTDEDIDCFAPFRGEGIVLTLKLNPDYVVAGENGGKLSELYYLNDEGENGIRYSGHSDDGEATRSYPMPTSVVAKSKTGGADLELNKDWTIVTLCNKLVNAPQDFIGNGSLRGYGMAANYTLLDSALGGKVVYHITSPDGKEYGPIAVETQGVNKNYYGAYIDENGDFHDNGVAWNGDHGNAGVSDIDGAASENTDIINYWIRRLNALPVGNGVYTLTIAAMSDTVDGIYYAQTAENYEFNVTPQTLGNDDEMTFNNLFDYTYAATVVEYSKGDEWINDIGLNLYLGKRNASDSIKLVQGTDYTIRNAADETSVGYVSLVIDGLGNLTGSHTISNLFSITPAENDWDIMPNIITWTYGTYKSSNNLIVGRPILLDYEDDITFKIVKIVKDSDGNITGEEDIAALANIHYYIDPNTGKSNGIVTDDVADALSKLDVGDYRLYASVYGSDANDNRPDRNYQPISGKSVDFTVFMGVNSWKAGVEPTVKDGGWIEGKLDTVDGLINAESVFGTPVLMIYDMEDNLIYSNLPDHENTQYGDINVLKGLKDGRYYLSAEVKETDNYLGLKTRVFFTVNPNNLPIWAVILIVAGSLGIVALVFAILHQKGILQMLTGKVIVSMRTRANVDATLAAIRAAKVAREAEASVAAAKAREAEEEAKAKNTEDK